MKYRSKPVEVEAVRFDGLHRLSNTVAFLDTHKAGHNAAEYVWARAIVGNWIIKDGDTFSVCSDEEFKRRYEEIK